MTMLAPGMSANPNSYELNSAPNAPAPGQQMLAMQQMQNTGVQNESTASAANSQKIMDITKEIAQAAQSAEEKANIFKVATAVGVQANAGGGQAKLALMNDPSFQEVGRRLFG